MKAGLFLSCSSLEILIFAIIIYIPHVDKNVDVAICLFYLNNLKRDPLEIQHPKFENSRLGFTESVHES